MIDAFDGLEQSNPDQMYNRDDSLRSQRHPLPDHYQKYNL